MINLLHLRLRVHLLVMSKGGQNAVVQAKAVLKSAGVDDKCVAIFGLVCSKAQEFNALDILKEACANLWV